MKTPKLDALIKTLPKGRAALTFGRHGGENAADAERSAVAGDRDAKGF
jgi:hypothetical protein